MDAAPLLYSRRDLMDRDLTRRQIEAAVLTQKLVLVRRGVYVEGDQWRDARAEQRVVARARALEIVSLRHPVFAHETAAALHGMPLYRADTSRVHVIAPHERPGAADGVIRHRGECEDQDVVDVDGMRCTNLTRTVADMARTASFERAVVVADSALHSLCVPRAGVYDQDLAAEFRTAAEQVVRRSAQGITRAARVLSFADGRAQLPGETISRIRLRELGFRQVSLQVEVPSRGMGSYYVDFGLDEVDSFGEFDGQMKYVEGRLLDGRSTAEVFDREKQREDWIRGTTQRRFVRWGWPHIKTAETLRSRLAAFGIRPPH